MKPHTPLMTLHRNLPSSLCITKSLLTAFVQFLKSAYASSKPSRTINPRKNDPTPPSTPSAASNPKVTSYPPQRVRTP
ncbi:hypothetical protein LENED_006423 [Lentinula edodes]|uniref:Uncharacterized protein n=1 Tax=Lentinula edodes TaxID=5353 RepID=A0A1Q3EBN5_LENED|nr:hypothetical protein LENED_006423 [Lentinula edodes]